MNHKLVFGCACAALVGPAGAAYAGFIEVGGWKATWDDSLDGLVEIKSPQGVVQVGGEDVLIIEKSAEFTQRPPLPGLPFPTIQITFIQTDPDAPNWIAIDDEIITNSTGVPWTDFHMTILNHNDAFFDPERTLATGGGSPIGFSIAPFTQAEFSLDNRTLDIWDGVVEPGEVWRPGSGVNNGLLWMAVTTHTGEPGDPFTVFTLKETPTPSPGGVVLLGTAGLVAFSRRRRA
jgi:hypothetical protein